MTLMDELLSLDDIFEQLGDAEAFGRLPLAGFQKLVPKLWAEGLLWGSSRFFLEGSCGLSV